MNEFLLRLSFCWFWVDSLSFIFAESTLLQRISWGGDFLPYVLLTYQRYVDRLHTKRFCQVLIDFLSTSMDSSFHWSWLKSNLNFHSDFPFIMDFGKFKRVSYPDNADVIHYIPTVCNTLRQKVLLGILHWEKDWDSFYNQCKLRRVDSNESLNRPLTKILIPSSFIQEGPTLASSTLWLELVGSKSRINLG